MIFDGVDRPALIITFEGDGIEESFDATDLIEMTMMRGRHKRNEPLQASTLYMAFDNSAGTYDTLTAGTQVASAVWFNGPGVDTTQIWGGLLHSVHQYRGLTPTTVVECRDMISYLDKQLLSPAYLNANGTETVNERATRIMTDYGWLAASVLENGGEPSGVLLLSSFGNMTATEAMQQCANASGGPYYTRRDRSIELADPALRLAETAPDLTFSDAGTTDTIPFISAVMSPASEQIVNAVTVSRPSRSTGAGQATSAVYVANTRAIRWDAPVQDDLTAEALACYLARIDATPSESVAELEFSGIDFLRNADLTTYVNLGLMEIGDRVDVTRLGVTYPCFIEGIKYQAGTRDWRIRLYLSPWNDYSVNLAGLAYTPAAGTFVYATPADWTITSAQDTVRSATSLDIKWRDFADRGAASGTLELYANAKQHVVYDSVSTGSFQFNCKGGSSTSMGATMDVGQCVEFDVLIRVDSSSHYANSVILVDGTSTHVTTIWLGGAPASGNAGGWDRYHLKVYYVNGEGTYRIVAQKTAS